MAKRRAFEVGETLGITDLQELIRLGDKAGVTIKNKMTPLEEEDVLKLSNALNEAKQTKIVEKRVGTGIIRRRAIRKPKSGEKAAPVEEQEIDDSELDGDIDETQDVVESDDSRADQQSDDGDSTESAAAEPEASYQSEAAEVSEVVEAAEAPAESAASEAPAEAEQPPVQAEDEPSAPAEADQPAEPEPAETSTRLPEPEVAAAPVSAAKEPVTVELDPAVAARVEVRDDDEDQNRRKARKPRQISKVVRQIDLSEINAPAAPRSSYQSGGPGYQGQGGGPRGGQSSGPIVNRRGGGRPTEAAVPDIIQPVVEYHGKRRSKDKPVDYTEAEGNGHGKGFRKRQVIDESYLGRRGRGGKKKRGEQEVYNQTFISTPKAAKRVIKMATDTILVGELAKRMGIKANQLIKELLKMGLVTQINQAIDLDTATLLANEFEYEVESVAFEEEKLLDTSETDKSEDMVARNPVVTVMGHVDHGKTSILDYIRHTRVAEGEAGGITQHIGAYVVHKDSGDITFLDTPGHEAFTSMRARGAQVTDIVILVVAADDGVMPQTIEAINHARGGNVPIIVAVNKIDKPNAKPEKVRTELMQHNILPEELGGDTILVNVSAKTGQGIDTLLEMVTLQADVLELKANAKKEQADAIVIEGKLDRGRGPVATVLVRQGTLRVGDNFVCGAQAGKIKAMVSDTGARIDEALPSQPVEILGFTEVPDAGETFNTLKNEKEAKQIAQNRYLKKRESELAKTSRVSLEELVARVKTGDMKTLSLVIKGDVQGTVGALRDALAKEGTDEVKIDIIHTGVGGITESDVLFASASKALIIGFNVRPEAKAQVLAEKEGIEIKLYNVIYDVIEDINDALLGLTAPKIREEILGHVEVRDTFTIPKIGTIAGCYVIDGKAVRGGRVRVLRDNIVIYTGKISSLRRFKDDVSEVLTGYECGVGIESFNDIKVGDQIEFFHDVEIKPVLNKLNATT